MSGLAGAVVWGVVPFAPAAPFRLYAGTERAPVSIPAVQTLLKGARQGGDPQFDYVVPGKARPVLVITDAHDEDLGEYLALRLARFSKLSGDERQRIREQRHPTLFHLKPEQFTLPDENAAMIAGLVRVHRSAIDPTPCGRLDECELRTVHERFVRYHRFDMRALLALAIEQKSRP